MSNNFLKLSASPLMNLDHTYRYSGTKLVEAETLSQHIVDTIMMGIKIIDIINNIEEDTLDISEYLMKAVYHDLEEVITGDIPRPVKYYNESTRMSLKDVADNVAREFFHSQFTDWESHYSTWDSAKEGKTGYILKIVDTLVVANKVVKEVTLLHNSYMLRVAHEVSTYLKELSGYHTINSPFDNDEINLYLSELIKDTIKSMSKILDDNRECMDSLNIYGQSMI